MLPKKSEIKALANQLDLLLQDAALLEEKFEVSIKRTHPAFRKSARNLLHYLALRQHDIRQLQTSLAENGLSSLGRTESHVLASLQAVRNQLYYLTDLKPGKNKPCISFTESSEILKKKYRCLAGRNPRKTKFPHYGNLCFRSGY